MERSGRLRRLGLWLQVLWGEVGGIGGQREPAMCFCISPGESAQDLVAILCFVAQGR